MSDPADPREAGPRGQYQREAEDEQCRESGQNRGTSEALVGPAGPDSCQTFQKDEGLNKSHLLFLFL